jgi:hypothetical protein
VTGEAQRATAAICIPHSEKGDIVLKRLATAGVLTVAVGGVLMSATPAMAGGDDFRFDRRHNTAAFDLDIKEFRKNSFTRNDTFAALNCVEIADVNILAQKRQNCIIGNVEND